jgi:hypothetical protein
MLQLPGTPPHTVFGFWRWPSVGLTTFVVRIVEVNKRRSQGRKKGRVTRLHLGHIRCCASMCKVPSSQNGKVVICASDTCIRFVRNDIGRPGAVRWGGTTARTICVEGEPYKATLRMLVVIMRGLPAQCRRWNTSVSACQSASSVLVMDHPYLIYQRYQRHRESIVFESRYLPIKLAQFQSEGYKRGTK